MRMPLLIAAAVLLVACGKSPDEIAVSAVSGGKVAKDGDKVTVQTDQGTVTYNAEAGQPLPATFPKDVFLPKDYSVRTTYDMGGAQMVDLVAPGKASDAFAAAGAAMPGMGWKQTASMTQAGTSVLVFENDAQLVQYSFNDEADQAHVAVSLTKKEK
jgi:hypothetical protein